MRTRWLFLIALMTVPCCDTRLELLPATDAATAESGLPSAGAPCTDSCGDGLTCYTTVGTPGNMAVLPGGLCSLPCAGPSDCPAETQCGSVEGVMICLPICNPMGGADCRSGYSCCNNQLVTTGTGACAPSSSNFCGN